MSKIKLYNCDFFPLKNVGPVVYVGELWGDLEKRIGFRDGEWTVRIFRFSRYSTECARQGVLLSASDWEALSLPPLPFSSTTITFLPFLFSSILFSIPLSLVFHFCPHHFSYITNYSPTLFIKKEIASCG